MIDEGDKKIAVYTCAEHEFSIIEDGIPGANPFDPYESIEHISALKNQSDFVVVLYHGGCEHYRYPSPKLRKRCRKMLEKGADLVICQHTHCVGCYEEYAGGTVVYGQGDFIFDARDNEFWNTAILVCATFGDTMKLEYMPVCKDGSSIRLATACEKDVILNGFKSRSEEIKEEGFVERQFLQIAKAGVPYYLYCLAGEEKSGRKYTDDFGKDYSPKQLSALFNCLNCEPHRELIMAATWEDIRQENEKSEKEEM